MEKYLFFSTGADGDATAEQAMYPASRFLGVEPLSATTTGIYFESAINDTDNDASAMAGDLITVTHADTHATAGSYHRSKLIAREISRAINARYAHTDGFITVMDKDNGVYLGEIDKIKADTSFGLAITLDT
jgi:hypothetical protein